MNLQTAEQIFCQVFTKRESNISLVINLFARCITLSTVQGIVSCTRDPDPNLLSLIFFGLESEFSDSSDPVF